MDWGESSLLPSCMGADIAALGHSFPLGPYHGSAALGHGAGGPQSAQRAAARDTTAVAGAAVACGLPCRPRRGRPDEQARARAHVQPTLDDRLFLSRLRWHSYFGDFDVKLVSVAASWLAAGAATVVHHVAVRVVCVVGEGFSEGSGPRRVVLPASRAWTALANRTSVPASSIGAWRVFSHGSSARGGLAGKRGATRDTHGHGS